MGKFDVAASVNYAENCIEHREKGEKEIYIYISKLVREIMIKTFCIFNITSKQMECLN